MASNIKKAKSKFKKILQHKNAEQPADEQLVNELPAAEKTADEKTTAELPADKPHMAKQTTYEQPAAEQPVDEQSAAEQTVYEQTTAEQPANEQTTSEPPSDELPVTEQATDEQTDDEQPADEQPEDEQTSDEPPVNAKQIDPDIAYVKNLFEGFDRDHIWAFNSGTTGTDFLGNPKFLFAYINNYRPDIKAYWLCSDEETINLVKSLGFEAFLSDTPEALYAVEKTGVCVSEQVKHNIPFKNVKYLNLWHAIGYKICERSRIHDNDDLRINLCQKYIKNNPVYLNQMLVTVTCKQQEDQFMRDMALAPDQMIRTGYARCTYQQKYKPIATFNHDILKEKGLPEDTKIAVYGPTFRYEQGNTFLNSIKDIDKLYSVCEKNRILLIFKMHPIMETEKGFLAAAQHYGDKPYFLFWNNKNDFYEIMNKADLLIYDYSSIYSDCLISGTKHFIRYIYDIEDMISSGYLENKDEYFERTSGTICKTFEEMLDAIDHYEEHYEPEVIEEIIKKQWSYAGEDDFEKTIKAVMDFKIKQDKYPVLYSFDVFDTLISRKGLDPVSIFYAVKEHMLKEGSFSAFFINKYPQIRQNAEQCVRKLRKHIADQEGSLHVEITLENIIHHIRNVYELTNEQEARLIQWEIDEELSAVIPVPGQIDRVRELKARGEDVILISDMYLPKDVILDMLKKADPMLSELPFYLSNEYGVLKTSGLLFFEIYRQVKPFYHYSKWIHCGDNKNADVKQPKKLNIIANPINKLEFNHPEQSKAESFACSDGFKIAAMESRMRSEFKMSKSELVIDLIAPIMVSYVDWVIRDALNKGFETLYFISRDGYPLKLAADALIQSHGWNIKTKYIYASRRVWRIPSYFDKIDADFWSDHGGNFNDIRSKENFIRALDIDDIQIFKKLFPEIDLDSIDFNDWSDGQPAKNLLPIIKSKPDYTEYLLTRASEKRKIVCDYLKQEIDPYEKAAYVEFNGRGYNQLCHSRLWNSVVGKEVPLYYYYAKSVQQTDGLCIRYNMTANSNSLLFMEAVFANMPYKSIEEYEITGGNIRPVISPKLYDKDLYEAMNELLPEYAKRYAALDLSDPLSADYTQFDFSLDYFNENSDNPFIYNNIGSLVDAVSMFAQKTQFARPYTMDDIDAFKEKNPRTHNTRSVTMSYMRSNPHVKEAYNKLYQIYDDTPVSEGNWLDEDNILKNDSFQIKYEEKCQESEKLKLQYIDACQETAVENLILILASKSASSSGDIVYSLMKHLDNQNVFRIEQLSASGAEDELFINTLAKSRFIICTDKISRLSGIELRPESTCIMLMSEAFDLEKHGFLRSRKLYWQKKHDELVYEQQVDHIEIPSKSRQNILMAERRLRKSAVETIKGTCATDVLFDTAYKESALSKLREALPKSADKKIIFLMPKLRTTKNDSWIEMPDLERLKEFLGDEYFVVLDCRKKDLDPNIKNILRIPGFSNFRPKMISTRMAMACADIIIGDFKGVFFEAALLSKPVYSMAWDYDKDQSSANLLWNYDEINPFPVVKSPEEIAHTIKQSDSYDYAPVKAFAENYLEYCDGHSGERLVKFILENNNNIQSDDIL